MNNESLYPRVLVISNNSFSKTNSNGRTLGNFFNGWPKDKLAQFCLISDGPDFEICNNYYCMSDRSALLAFLTISKPKRTFFDSSKSGMLVAINDKTQKTSCKMLLRSIMWKCCRWNNTEFNAWIEKFAPDLILFTNGDSFFMLDIARKLSISHHVPLVIFNTEGYYFFENNYFKNSFTSRILFPLYRHLYRRSFKKLMQHADFSIYGNSKLKEDYDNEFHKDGIVLYTGSSIDYRAKDNLPCPPTFSYLGSFGFKRYETLIEISEVLHEMNHSYRLNVYGDAADSIREKLNQAPYVDYKGFVSYSQVIDVMHDSDILFHVENQDAYLQESLKYGFSTKIADSLACGTLFCLYSSPDIACAKYIIENHCAVFASNLSDLRHLLTDALTDDNKRMSLIERAHEIALENHDMQKNAEKFRSILIGILK